MRLVAQARADGVAEAFAVPTAGLRIGSDPGADVHLDSLFVEGVHARVVPDADGVYLESLGANATEVNDGELLRGERRRLFPGDVIRIQGFVLQVAHDAAPGPAIDVEGRARYDALLARLHGALVQRLDPRDIGLASLESEEGRRNVLVAASAELGALAVPDDSGLQAHAGREALRAGLRPRTARADADLLAGFHFGNPQEFGTLERERGALIARLASALALEGRPPRERNAALRAEFDTAFATLWPGVAGHLRRHLVRWLLRKDMLDLVFGLGPLTDLLETPDVTEVMVVSRDRIYVEQDRELVLTGRSFISDADVERIVERIVSRVGRRVDTATPMADARLPDGSRVNVVIPPVALKGPCLTIRRFSRRRQGMGDLVANGTLDERVAAFLEACVRGKRNIVISGGTGTGKTTLLGALSAAIPEGERIVTIEDAAELQLAQDHVVSLEARPANVEGEGAITIRDLVRNALRMRPDRIVVGECRGGEALDMLQAMNTGHAGSMTTAHANSPADMLDRLLNMLLQAVQMPVPALRQQIGSAIDLVVQLERRPAGRFVTAVTEVVGFDEDSGNLVHENVFERRADGRLAFTGHLPTFSAELVRDAGLDFRRVFQ